MSDDSRIKQIAKATVIAVSLAVPAEGLRQVAYRDPPGILTVCVGHTGADIVPGKRYSMAECNKLLDDDMRKAVVLVERCAPGLPPGVLAAFSDATFNLGPVVACDRSKSTAARLLHEGSEEWRKTRSRAKLDEACRQLPKWDKARVAGVMVALPGLTKRRELESQVCLDRSNDE